MKARCLSLDLISTLPQNIIETILCLVPIQDAARTSILSRKWRYNWLTIPKLEFIEMDFIVTTEVTTNENQVSILERMIDPPNERNRMTKRCRMFYAIYQILLVHRGPIHEFILRMDADNSCVEIDQIILHLSRNHTVKKFKLKLTENLYRLPLSIFSLHQLTDLHLVMCTIDYVPKPFNGFGRLTSLHLDDVCINTKKLLRIISSSPSLKNFYLVSSLNVYRSMCWTAIVDLFKCLSVIEHISISYSFFTWGADEAVPQELPTSLVHLKSLCLEDMYLRDKFGLPFLILLIRRSPNLEKIKLRIDGYRIGDKLFEVDYGDYSDICLENLNEFKITDVRNLKPEMDFVKLILAKSPVLKKVSIGLNRKVDKDQELKMLRIFLRYPRASPLVDIIVKHPYRRNYC